MSFLSTVSPSRGFASIYASLFLFLVLGLYGADRRNVRQFKAGSLVRGAAAIIK